MDNNSEEKVQRRVPYGRRNAIYDLNYDKLSHLYDYHKKVTGNTVHVLTFGLINANIFIKKLRKLVARRRARGNKVEYKLEKIDQEDEPDLNYSTMLIKFLSYTGKSKFYWICIMFLFTMII